MASNVYLQGAQYSNVPSIELPASSQGGTSEFYDARSVTYSLSGGATVSANPSNAIAGQGFSVKLKAPAGYTLSNVSVTMGGVDITSTAFEPDTSSGGGGGGGITITEEANATGTTLVVTSGGGGGGTPSATSHEIYFEFSDSTNTTITGYWDDSFISNAITATTPTTYNNKTVTLAQLDSVTWYEPAGIPIGVQLVDYNDVQTGYYVDANSGVAVGDSWDCVTDYLPIDRTMTFSFTCSQYASIGFFDSTKSFLRGVTANDIATSTADYFASGTLDSTNIPNNSAYVVLQGNSYSIDSSHLSFIRTA